MSLENRIKVLEALLPKPKSRMSYAERFALEAANTDAIVERVRNYDERVERERQEYEALSPDERIARKRAELATVRAQWEERAEGELGGGFLQQLRLRSLELDLAELEGTVSPEVLAVARWQNGSPGRAGAKRDQHGWFLLPTQEEAVAILESGQVEYLPESLRERYGRKPTSQLVPYMAGPGPYLKPPPRDPMRPFKGRYGSLDEIPDKLKGYGCGQPDWGKESPFEPKVV